MPGFAQSRKRPESLIEERQRAAYSRCQAILRHNDSPDPGIISDDRIALTAVLEACADYLKSRRIPYKRGKVARPWLDHDELLTALGIPAGSPIDRRLKQIRKDLLR